MSDEHTDACNPGNCDISGVEFTARETARRRLAELNFPPLPVRPPKYRRRSLRFFLLFYGAVGLLAFLLAPVVTRWLTGRWP